MKSSSLRLPLIPFLFVAIFALSGCGSDTLTGPEDQMPEDRTVQTETNSCDPCNTDPPDGHNTSPYPEEQPEEE